MLFKYLTKLKKSLSDEDFKEMYNTDVNNDDEFVNIGYQ